MAQLIVAAAGAALGAAIPGVGAAIGWAIGGAIGGMFGPTQKSSGPRLSDLKVTAAEYGAPIPYIFGHPRVAGTVIWASEKRELSDTQRQGKGGGGAEYTSYTYEIDLLILLGDNELFGIRRIWSSGKLVWSMAEESDDETIDASADSTSWRALRFYSGADGQLPDTTYEAAVGSGNAPAYIGRTTVMLEGVNLGSSGQLPNLTFEVTQRGERDQFAVVWMLSTFNAEIADQSQYHHPTEVAGSVVRSLNSRFGTHSISTDNSGGTLTNFVRMSSASSGLESGAFCVEISVSLPNISANDGNSFLRCGGITIGSYGDVLYVSLEPSVIGAGAPARTVTYAFTGAWVDVCVDRSNGGLMRVFFNGVLADEFSATGVVDFGVVTLFGFVNNTEPLFTMFADNFRIVRGLSLRSDDYPVEEVSDLGDVGGRVTLEDVPLDEVVAGLCGRCGVPAAEVDVTALANRYVYAMAVQPTSARAVLEQLAAAYYFECVESDKLYFRMRGAAVAATVPYWDLGADSLLALQQANDLELPAQVNVSYLNLSNAYQQGNEMSDRLATDSTAITTLQLAMGLTPSVAKAIADTAVLDQAVAARTFAAAVDVRYARVEPTDVLVVQDSVGMLHRARVVKVTESAGVRSLEMVADDARVLQEVGITGEDYDDDFTVLPIADTDLVILDIPILRDRDDNPGLYAAGDGLRGTWPGYQLRVDGAESGTSSSGAQMGAAQGALGDWASALVDESHVLTVTFNPGDQITSITHEALTGGIDNYAAIGAHGRWEIVQFQSATLTAPGTYRITGLLRGQLGTEWARATHQADDRFVMLTGEGMLRWVGDAATRGQSREFEAVTLGGRLDGGTSVALAPDWEGLKPYAPVNVRISPGAGGAATISWDRRTRFQQNFLLGQMPLGEVTQAYEVDIYQGAGVVRTLRSAMPAVSYALEQQISDFGAAVSSLTTEVFQVSSIVGRGHGSGKTTRILQGAVQQLRAQIATISVGGSVSVGSVYQVTLAGQVLQYVASSGDAPSDVADALGALAAGLPGYAVEVAGAVVSVEGQVGVAFAIAATVQGGGSISIQQTQQGSPFATPGDRGRVTYFLGTGLAEGAFTVRFRRLEGVAIAFELAYSVSFSAADAVDLLYVPARLVDAFLASGDQAVHGIVVGAQSEPGVNSVSLYTPVGDPNWQMVADSTNPSQPMVFYTSRPAELPLPMQPQKLLLTVGAVAEGVTYITGLGRGFLYEEFSTTASVADTSSSIAAALAAQVDASPNWIATHFGDSAEITSAVSTSSTSYGAFTSLAAASLTVNVIQTAA